MTTPALSAFSEFFGLNKTELAIVFVALLFIVLGLASMTAIFVSRLIKSSREKKMNDFILRFQSILNSLIVNESVSSRRSPGSAFEFKQEQLKAVIGGSTFAGNVLITQLIHLKKSLAGNASLVLERTYRHLALRRISFSKIKGHAWPSSVKGIRELAEMNETESLPIIEKHLRSENKFVREEALMSLMRLQQEKILVYLSDYSIEISPWLKLNIHHYLATSGRTVPLFKSLLSHPKESVRLFAIDMIRTFRQMDAGLELSRLIRTKSESVAVAAIRAIGDLSLTQYSDEVALQLDNSSPLVVVAALDVLSRIAESQRSIMAIKLCTSHPDYDVRFQAFRTLRALGFSEEKLREVAQSNGQDQIALVQHINEPLLQ